MPARTAVIPLIVASRSVSEVVRAEDEARLLTLSSPAISHGLAACVIPSERSESRGPSFQVDDLFSAPGSGDPAPPRRSPHGPAGAAASHRPPHPRRLRLAAAPRARPGPRAALAREGHDERATPA